MEYILFIFLLYGIPLAAVVWFIVSLILFVRTPKSEIQRRRRAKVRLIISAVMAGIFLAALIALMITFFIAIAHM